MIEVCPTCYKFLLSVYDRKKMKDVKLADANKTCKSIYHKKLVD
ncbi:MAG: hypothetical protein ACREBU_11175 [Nitrososphaera sp.]